jgi:anti-sigma regulatory factor (Ser/Thr protein kinase)
LTGFRCPFRGVPWLDVCRRVERASACVRPPARAIPGDEAAGKAGALMAGRTVRETVTLAGRAERARLARAFVEGVLGPGHPCGDVATLLVDELFVNSIRHSGSGAPGETVTVAVKIANNVIRVEVTDRSGPGVPEPRPAGSDAEDGRGLHLVARLAARWGWRRRGGRMVTWFELSHPC